MISPKSNGVALVSCVSRKHNCPRPARELYRSDWFLKARSVAESSHPAWFILSAKHGLVEPKHVLRPYDTTLLQMPVAAGRAWAKKVARQCAAVLPRRSNLVIFAGARYREFLVPLLHEAGFLTTIPLEGLRIGEQLRALKKLAAAE